MRNAASQTGGKLSSRSPSQTSTDDGRFAAPSPPRNTPVPRHWELPRIDRFNDATNGVQLKLLQPASDPTGAPVVYQTLMPVLKFPPTQQPYPGRIHGSYGDEEAPGTSRASVFSFPGNYSSSSSNRATRISRWMQRRRYHQMHLGKNSESPDFLLGRTAKHRSQALVSDKLWPDEGNSDLVKAPATALPPISAALIKPPRREIVVPENLRDIIRRKLKNRTHQLPLVDNRDAAEEDD